MLPIANNKKPAIKSWKPLQLKRADPSDITLWFDGTAFTGSVQGLGIILGDISGGLAVRDFDDPDAYEAWKAQFPEFAAILPTVQTGRGFHVYARIPGCKTRKLGDGELRAEGSYVVAPPSMHVSGTEYHWIVPLLVGEIPTVDESIFLEDIGTLIHKSNKAIWRESLELPGTPMSLDSLVSPGTPKSLGSPEGHGDLGIPVSPEPHVYGKQADAFIHEAIQASLPKGVGKRNDAIFDFARRLKAHQELAKYEGLQLRTAMEWWFKAARGIIGTKDWDETWSDFLHAWDNVRTPFGESMQAVLDKARVASDPKCAAQFSAEPTKLLVRLCRELQHRASEEPFFLDCRTAGEAIETNKDSAHKRIRHLMQMGILERISKGHTGRASEFRYLSD